MSSTARCPPPAAGLQDHRLAASIDSIIGRSTDAESHLNRMLALKPADAETLLERGRIRERSGRPDEAAADFAGRCNGCRWTCSSGRAAGALQRTDRGRRSSSACWRGARTTRSCSSPSGWTKLAGAIGAAVAAFDRAGWFGAANEYTFDHACLRFLAGDAKSYRRLVARMAADDGRTTDAARCLVSPALARWPPAPLPPRPTWCWGERAARGDPSPWVLHALGLTYLRAGRPLDAIRLLEKSAAAPDSGRQVTNWLSLALAHRAWP